MLNYQRATWLHLFANFVCLQKDVQKLAFVTLQSHFLQHKVDGNGHNALQLCNLLLHFVSAMRAVQIFHSYYFFHIFPYFA